MLHKSLACAFAIALGAMTFGAHADVLTYKTGQAVDPHEVARILGHAPAPERILTRSIRLIDAPEAAPAARQQALSLPVQFNFDSAEIAPAARGQLDALAEGIKMLPATQAVVIEGHTDARGTEEYNASLSYRRATSVRRYLVQVHGIEETRLKALGLGKEAPLDGRDPYAPENRRVQFHGARG